MSRYPLLVFCLMISSVAFGIDNCKWVRFGSCGGTVSEVGKCSGAVVDAQCCCTQSPLPKSNALMIGKQLGIEGPVAEALFNSIPGECVPGRLRRGLNSCSKTLDGKYTCEKKQPASFTCYIDKIDSDAAKVLFDNIPSENQSISRTLGPLKCSHQVCSFSDQTKKQEEGEVVDPAKDIR